MDARLTLIATMDDVFDYRRWLETVAHERIGCDTETTGFDWYRDDLRVVQFGDAEHGWVIPWDTWSGLVHWTFDTWKGNVVFHNAKFDLHFLKSNGVEVPRHQVHDTMLMRAVVSPERLKGLKPTAAELIHPLATAGEDALKRGMMKHGWDWRTVPIEFEPYWQYAALDPVLTCRIMDVLYPKVADNKAYQLDLAVMLVVMDMECRGQLVDVGYVRQQSVILKTYEETLLRYASDTHGLTTLSRDKELIKWFTLRGVNFMKRTDRGNYSLDEEVLQSLVNGGDAAAQVVLNYRRSVKKRKTYFDSWISFVDENDLLHPSFNMVGARTGRMSASRPNLQNVPRERYVRNGLIPHEGNKLVLADFDQIELRIMACRANERTMIDAINAGEDYHGFTAKLVYHVSQYTKEQRRIAKHSNFAKIYGAGIAKFAATAQITVEEATRFIASYESMFPGITAFQNEYSNLAPDADGYIRSLSPYVGRLQVAPAGAGYKLVNYLIQGEAADVLKMKLVELSNTDYGDYMTIPIHDEIAFDVPAEDAEKFARGLPEIMEERVSYAVPLTVGVEIVDRWGDKYE